MTLKALRMTFNPEKHHRRSIRLKGYDYGQPGAYYVTICTANHQCSFGEIHAGETQLSPLGEIVQEEWLRSAEMRRRVTLDAFVVMPNHLHGIIILGDLDETRVSDGGAELSDVYGRAATRPSTTEQFGKPTTDTIPTIVRLFKSAATKRINIQRGTPGASAWHRNYYEHVVRDLEDLNRIREYITANPARWADDIQNPNKL